MEDVVSHFKKLNGATGWGEWEVDQVKKLPSSFFMGVLGFDIFFGPRCPWSDLWV